MAWVIFDVNNLAWRAFHTTGGLKFGTVQTGVTYGVLREVRMQLDRHMTTDAVFCFDSKASVRAKQFPGYKAKRKTRQFSDEEQAAYAGVQEQIDALREDYLPSLGFKNRLLVKGFEADDMVAAACSILEGEEIHIVSSDKDLYQLLSDTVTLWKPGKGGTAYTKKLFCADYDLPPNRWPDIKAIAGCSTDDIPGVRGVGEKTAATVLGGIELFGDWPARSKKEIAVEEFMKSDQYALNLKLVTLPHPDLDIKPIRMYRDCKPTERQWRRLQERLGIKSLG